MKKIFPVIIVSILFIWLINKCSDNTIENECVEKYYNGDRYKYEFDLKKYYNGDVELMKVTLDSATVNVKDVKN